jgi:hypothetical protein
MKVLSDDMFSGEYTVETMRVISGWGTPAAAVPATGSR